jgi:hypothetical protein
MIGGWMDDFDIGGLFGPPSPFDVEAFLRGDLQGRGGSVSYGADHAPVMEYLKTWHLPEEDYWQRREALDSRQYGRFGSCPKCGAEAAIYVWPGKDDWVVCSAGCKVRWCVGAGLFSAHPNDQREHTEEELEEIVERLFREYEEVEPLYGWKLDLLEGWDVGIRMLSAKDVEVCVVCGFAAIPDDLRKLSSFIHFGRELPLLSLNRQAPLCMVCGGEFDHALQEAVNEMWGLDRPVGIGKMISTPHSDLE